jgi:hypothetical protein
MVAPISSPIPTQAVARPTPALQPAPQAKPQPAPAATVQISAAAANALAFLQEATETRVQTTKEAGSGDIQARNLLAREAAQGH